MIKRDSVKSAHKTLSFTFLGVSVLGELKFRWDLLTVDRLAKSCVELRNNRARRIYNVWKLVLVTESVDVHHLICDDVINVLRTSGRRSCRNCLTTLIRISSPDGPRGDGRRVIIIRIFVWGAFKLLYLLSFHRLYNVNVAHNSVSAAELSEI